MAPLIAKSVLEDIRVHSDIVAIISSYFKLQPSGAIFKALCPFHKEKTPSFIVNPQRQIYHCFGCGAGGDVFRFIMEYDKVDFMAAAKMLAQRANIPLALTSQAGRQEKNKDALYAIHDQVARLYHQCLLQAAAATKARSYLKARDLPLSVIERFQIGFAPDRYDTLLKWAKKPDQREQLLAAGLILAANTTTPANTSTNKPTHYYDRFRNRLMFPIQDEQGRVVGFSGRIIETSDSRAAKYINSPETTLFHKGRILYALHKARRAIAEAQEAIICEGQIDVIRCHLAGFTTAVAAQGTAFTDHHAQILKRYADSVVLVFDADRAGQNAALRAAEVFLQANLAVRIAALPNDKDPDSLLRHKDGPAQFQLLIKNARSIIDFQIDVLSQREAHAEAGLMRVSAAVLQMISHSPNAVQQARMIQQAAKRLGVSEEALRKEWQRLEKNTRPTPRSADAQECARPPIKELALAEHLAADLSLAQWVKNYLPLNLLVDPLCRQMLKVCLEAAHSHQELMSLVTACDNETRDLSHFAAQVLAAPAKVKGHMSTNEDSVKSLILGIRADILRKRRKEIERNRRMSRAGMGARLTPEKDKELELEYCHLGYDLAKLQTWETAVPVMELL